MPEVTKIVREVDADATVLFTNPELTKLSGGKRLHLPKALYAKRYSDPILHYLDNLHIALSYQQEFKSNRVALIREIFDTLTKLQAAVGQPLVEVWIAFERWKLQFSYGM